MIGVPGPRLSPEFSPVSESTELGRSLPRLVASATASRMVCRIAIWLVPTGTWTSKVGMPVSWQMAPWSEHAWSMFSAMIASDCEARDPSISASWARFMAARTSGGQVGGRLGDQRDEAVEQRLHGPHYRATIGAWTGSASSPRLPRSPG